MSNFRKKLKTKDGRTSILKKCTKGVAKQLVKAALETEIGEAIAVREMLIYKTMQVFESKGNIGLVVNVSFGTTVGGSKGVSLSGKNTILPGRKIDDFAGGTRNYVGTVSVEGIAISGEVKSYSKLLFTTDIDSLLR